MQLENKTAIVTGASSGIGRASAEALARAGFTVFGTSRKITSQSPQGASMVTCDVTDEESVASLVSAVLAQTGRIDLLVNNVGIGLLGGAEESSVSQSQALFDVNLFGMANGDHDRMVPSVNTADLTRRIPGAQPVIYEDAGHGGVFQNHTEYPKRCHSSRHDALWPGVSCRTSRPFFESEHDESLCRR